MLTERVFSGLLVLRGKVEESGGGRHGSVLRGGGVAGPEVEERARIRDACFVRGWVLKFDGGCEEGAGALHGRRSGRGEKLNAPRMLGQTQARQVV